MMFIDVVLRKSIGCMRTYANKQSSKAMTCVLVDDSRFTLVVMFARQLGHEIRQASGPTTGAAK